MRTALIVGALAAGALGMFTAPAAFAAGESASLTIARLEAEGFDVKINRIGSAALAECVVTDIRNPREPTQPVRVDDSLVPVVVGRSISVTVDCSR